MTGPIAERIISPRIRRLKVVPPQIKPPELGPRHPVRGLHLNESPFPPAPSVIEAMQQAAARINRYPDHDGGDLVRALSVRTSVAAERIVVGAGSNELLYASADIALDPGHEAIAPNPGFPTYEKAIAMRGGDYIGVPVRDDGSVDVPAVLAAVTSKTRLVFVASPHNPTGGMLARDDIECLVRELPDDVLLHFDEAYYEFGRHAGGVETLPILERRRGPWIATRSFSKAYGLAGIRVGYGLTNSRELADAYRKIRVNFSVNAVALAGARAALDADGHMQRLLDHTAMERRRLAAVLEEIGFEALPSAANFLTAKTPKPATALAAALREENIFVLPFLWPGMPGAIRITIGSSDDTDVVATAIPRLLKAL